MFVDLQLIITFYNVELLYNPMRAAYNSLVVDA